MNKQPAALSWVTIALGSFLLFGVQPMLGRTLLPSFGGTAAVWTVCLAAYQTLLLAGYFYAHAISGRTVRTQRAAHTVLMVLAVVWTAGFALCRPALKAWIGNSGVPALEVLFCVLAIVGLPYVLLSAGSTLVQAWLERAGEGGRETGDGRGVYKLYAISNLGSFAGLLVYPFLLEPHVPLTVQWWGFAAGLGLYTALLWRMAGQTGGRLGEPSLPEPGDAGRAVSPKPPHGHLGETSLPGTAWLWVALPAVSVFLLNAVTAHLTLDVMPLPLLWVVLLAAFLLSYVAGFSGRLARWNGWVEGATVICVVVLALTTSRTGGARVYVPNLLAGVGVVAFGATLLHGWLYRIRPGGALLTRYYLCNALGGAIGGILASLVAPILFNEVSEFPIALVLLAFFTVLHRWMELGDDEKVKYLVPRWAHLPLLAGIVAMVIFNTFVEDTKGRKVIHRARGFYGTVTVTEVKAATGGGAAGVLREFVHGSTVHGVQARIPGKERMTTAYYTPDSGGLAITQHPGYKRGLPMRVGLVGMGVGVMLGHCRPNDTYICYEINPQVINLATNPAMFSFVEHAPGRVELRMGDARKILEVEAANKEPLYDVLVLDALTGDNIPAHLSTREAFRLYFERLSPEGILAVNISNWHLDLLPLIKSVSDEFEIPAVAFMQADDFAKLRFTSMWAFMMRKPPRDFTFPADARMLPLQQAQAFRLPKDERGSFVSLIRW
ncbi:MAG TPA: fused MFS/spermidine synthase [Lentisphaeria bacterium]|nr:fused MFS/spermidine synthase [Lentisphaeria bacterium]